MERTRGEILAHRIVKGMDGRRQLSEETLRRLATLVAEDVIDAEGGADEGLLDLEREMSARYAYGMTSELEGFDSGACWGMLVVLRTVMEARVEHVEMERSKDIVRKHLRLFKMVDDRPGIAQGKLAEALGEKKSNFSQKLARLNKYHVLTVGVVGRSKHLYLTRRGEGALRQVLANEGGCAALKRMPNVRTGPINTMTVDFAMYGAADGRHRALVAKLGEGDMSNLKVVKSRARSSRIKLGNSQTIPRAGQISSAMHSSNRGARAKNRAMA